MKKSDTLEVNASATELLLPLKMILLICVFLNWTDKNLRLSLEHVSRKRPSTQLQVHTNQKVETSNAKQTPNASLPFVCITAAVKHKTRQDESDE